MTLCARMLEPVSDSIGQLSVVNQMAVTIQRVIVSFDAGQYGRVDMANRLVAFQQARTVLLKYL